MCSELRDTTARKHYYFFPENHIVKLPKKRLQCQSINQSLQICAGIANYWCKSDGSSRYDMILRYHKNILRYDYDSIQYRSI